MYERKTKSDRWIPIPRVALTTLKAGEGFKLELHAQELWTLFEGVLRLYNFYGQHGIPKGRRKFLELDQPLAEFVSLGEKELTTLLESPFG